MPQFLSSIYKVSNRFQRSIQVVQDWKSGIGLDGYLLSSTAREITLQIIRGFQTPKYSTAWTITGPYGTGKSAFALFLTDILANRNSVHNEAQKIKDQSDSPIPLLLPVLVQGQRTNINIELLSVLSSTFSEVDPKFSEKVKENIPGNVENKIVLELYQKAIIVAQNSGYDGILVIIDEFGKFLEYASANPNEVDLLLLQELAEVATRKTQPFGLITILHSAFSDYLSDVETEKKAEWQKVQGRFSDISFIEPAEQFLKLISKAIISENSESYMNIAKEKVRAIVNSKAYDEVRNRINITELAEGCLPLHPSTALLLWPIFRSSLSQNERSLFSFLNDFSLHGFQDFLSSTKIGERLYSLADLYDYISYTVGDAVLLSLHARRWAEISNAINRIQNNTPPLYSEIVKTIGLVSIFGSQIGLSASKEFLFSLYENPTEISKAIDYLEEKSIIIYRKFQGAYAIWEGSDVDLDAAFAQAQMRSQKGGLAERLQKLVNPGPIVARAHYIKKGTMRFFNVSILDGDLGEIKSELGSKKGFSDGDIYFVLSENNDERQSIIDRTLEITKSCEPGTQLKIFAFPKPFKGLESALRLLENWYWVKENTPVLAGDRTARQEVLAQIRNATRKLFDIAGETFGLHGYPLNPRSSVWIQDGKLWEHETIIDFQSWLSNICEDVFCKSPALFNELLNRENISSSASAIRRNLVQRMLEHDGEVDLGFDGTPPEYSMYRSLLVEGGFYGGCASGRHGFTDLPINEWQPIWFTMNEFLQSTVSTRRPLKDLYEILKSPPFGLREGPIPVLICDLLLANKDKIALYEEGRFIPEIRIEILELLIKVPEIFEIQLYKLEGETKAAFEAIGEVIEQLNLKERGFEKRNNLLDVIKPLVVFVAKLPEYTKKKKTFSVEYVVEVRDALLRAQDPYQLLFYSIPSILHVDLNSLQDINVYSVKLKDILFSLRQAYPDLLDRIEENIREAFDYQEGTPSTELRDDLVKRATLLSGYSTDPTLNLFIREAQRLDHRDWREVLSRSINQGLPTDKWLDRSVVDFQLRLVTFSKEFVRLENLVREHLLVDDNHIVMQLSILDGQMKDLSKIVSLRPEIEDETQKLVDLLFKELKITNNKNVKFAALGKLLERLITSDEYE